MSFFEEIFKVPVLGDANVGKTSIVTKYQTGTYTDKSAPTVGISNTQFPVDLGDGQTVMLNVWDTAGQERFRSLIPLYTRGASLILLVFGVDQRDSFAACEGWINKVRETLRLTCPIILVGNRNDLESEVSLGDARKFADKYKCPLIFTSAKTGENITELFNLAASMISTHGAAKQEHSMNIESDGGKKKCC